MGKSAHDGVGGRMSLPTSFKRLKVLIWGVAAAAAAVTFPGTASADGPDIPPGIYDVSWDTTWDYTLQVGGPGISATLRRHGYYSGTGELNYSGGFTTTMAAT